MLVAAAKAAAALRNARLDLVQQVVNGFVAVACDGDALAERRAGRRSRCEPTVALAASRRSLNEQIAVLKRRHDRRHGLRRDVLGLQRAPLCPRRGDPGCYSRSAVAGYSDWRRPLANAAPMRANA